MTFAATSRYYNLDTETLDLPSGQTVIYLTRRFVPQPESFALLQLYTVVQGDRLDNVTAKFLTDPQQFWRLCDANRALRPEELVQTVGRKLRITMPQGITGVTNA